MNTTATKPEVSVDHDDQSFGGIPTLSHRLINMVNGLPGFENLHDFILAELEGYAPFCAFKSVEQPDISMVVIDAKLLSVWKDVTIPPRELQILDLQDTCDSEQFIILKIDQGTQQFTGNIKAPIVFNPDSGLANQVILDNSNLSVEHPLNSELAQH